MSFWVFEAGRLYYWIPAFVTFVAVWIVTRRSIRWRGRPFEAWIFAATLGVGLEVLTSVLYWRSNRSFDVRDLFQSPWYWGRVPRVGDLGWHSFPIYLYHHLIPWALVMLLGLTLSSSFINWRARRPITNGRNEE
jgi:hypothetical protein